MGHYIFISAFRLILLHKLNMYNLIQQTMQGWYAIFISHCLLSSQITAIYFVILETSKLF